MRDESRHELGAILDEARAQVAAGRAPDAHALRARIRALATDERALQETLARLERVASVHRARALVAREPSPPSAPAAPAPARSLRSALRTRPTIVGNLDVRRERRGDALALAWDAVPAVAVWEVRFSERPDVRSDYRELSTLELPAAVTSVELPLGDRLFRANVIGRGRDGRPVRRALISALTRETWGDRWQRRATAS